MHAWLSPRTSVRMYVCVQVCVCVSICECVLSGKYFLPLLPPAAAWGLPANILEYFYTKRQRQSDEGTGTGRRQTSAPPAACTTTVLVAAAAALPVMVRGHRRPSTCIPTSTISPVSMCCNVPLAASGAPCVAVSHCVCCCWRRRRRTVDGCTDRISGWLVGFAQELLF